MKIIISPAKKLDLQSRYPNLKYTKPFFINEAEKIISVMQQKSPNEVKALMKLSDNLSQLNWERYQNWKKEIDENARPAIFTFNGNVYNGISAKTLTKNELEQLNKKLYIISGLYGLLKPFDLIYPYRMEMGSKLTFNSYKNLYEFWQDKITHQLNQELSNHDFLVNLASQEYFKAINIKKIKMPIYEPIFKEYKNGELKTISLYAKIARGLMTRFIIQNNINNIQELKLFNINGYAFDESLSSDYKLVFTR